MRTYQRIALVIVAIYAIPFILIKLISFLKQSTLPLFVSVGTVLIVVLIMAGLFVKFMMNWTYEGLE